VLFLFPLSWAGIDAQEPVSGKEAQEKKTQEKPGPSPGKEGTKENPAKKAESRLDKIAARVRRALLGEREKVVPVASYRALLTLDFRHPKKGKFTVQVTQDFRAPRSVRTVVKEPQKHIMRGHDGTSYWQVLKGGKVVLLDKREYKQDKATIRKEYRFANQVLRLFRVDRLLGEMENREPVTEEKKKVIWGEGKKLVERKCLIVEGEVERFPFYKINLPPDYKEKVRLRLCLDAEEGLPIQVQAWPALFKRPETAYLRSELVQLYAYWREPATGLKVPTVFRISTVHPEQGLFFTDLVVTLEELSLNRDFPKDHFSPAQARQWAARSK